MMSPTCDVLVVGAGPAGVALAAALSATGLRVRGLNPAPPEAPWPNTYGIWRDELEASGLTPAWLGRQWQDCSVYTTGQEIPLRRTYGLFDNQRLQADLLARCAEGDVVWEQGLALGVTHNDAYSQVAMGDGRSLTARLVVDASGHKPALVRRPAQEAVAFQAAYGIIGRFSRSPVRAGQMVLMDYRAQHLPPEAREEPPTFLYAMDFGDGVTFVEETSLAHAPPVAFGVLQRRLQQRLNYHGIQVRETQHVEHCLFPMNLALPDLTQPLLGYGGAASMVHPASGYQVGAALRHASEVAQAVAAALAQPDCTPAAAARAGWQTLWSPERIRKRNLYLFGLANLLRFDVTQTQHFFESFFALPYTQWSGYLSNTLITNQVLQTMWQLFRQAPNDVRWSLATSVGQAGNLLWKGVRR